MHPGGRPPKLTKKRVDIIVKAIRDGNTRQCAASLAGIAYDTLYDWLKKGRAGDPVYVKFAERIQEADGIIESKMVAVIRCAATSSHDWKAANAWLGRRRQKTWGDQAHELIVKTEGNYDLSTLSDADLAAFLETAKKMKKES